MSLLDQNFYNCLIKWRGDKPTSKIKAPIENLQGENIGLINLVGSIKRHVDLFDSKDTKILSSSSSMMRNKFEITDSNGTLIGRSKEASGWRKAHLIIEDLNKKEILTVSNLSKLAVVHNVQTPNKNTIAIFDIGKMKDNYTCNFQVKEHDFDKKILWGSFLSILNSFYNGTNP